MKKQRYFITLSALVLGLSFGLAACLTGKSSTPTDPPAATTPSAVFLFASEDGIISAWSSGNTAVQVAKSASDKAVYKSLAVAALNGTHYIYAANFRESKIDVYDTGFHHQNGAPFQGTPFVDAGSPAIPSDYGPFGITNIGGLLYVTYAEHKPDPNPDDNNKDDLAGPGHGFISVFNPDGSFVRRFASMGSLNSPWAVAVAPAGFGSYAGDYLVNNFGDGTISAFGSDGHFISQLKNSSGTPVTIEGLWAIKFADASTGLNANWLYFSAGPADESHGLFGYVNGDGSVVNLVSDTAGYGAARIDPNLVNGWGIAIGATGKIWVNSNEPGLSLVYDGQGNQVRDPVTIPARDAATGGSPSGAIFMTSTDFHMPK